MISTMNSRCLRLKTKQEKTFYFSLLGYSVSHQTSCPTMSLATRNSQLSALNYSQFSALSPWYDSFAFRSFRSDPHVRDMLSFNILHGNNPRNIQSITAYFYLIWMNYLANSRALTIFPQLFFGTRTHIHIQNHTHRCLQAFDARCHNLSIFPFVHTDKNIVFFKFFNYIRIYMNIWLYMNIYIYFIINIFLEDVSAHLRNQW